MAWWIYRFSRSRLVRRRSDSREIPLARQVYRVEDQEFSLHKGEGFLIEPNKQTFYQAGEEDPWTYLWIGFDGAKCESCLRSLGLGPWAWIRGLQPPQRPLFPAQPWWSSPQCPPVPGYNRKSRKAAACPRKLEKERCT